jgi:hypothetical protein
MSKRSKLADRLLLLALLRRDVGAVQRILIEYFGQRIGTAHKLAQHAVNRFIAKQSTEQSPFSKNIEAY